MMQFQATKNQETPEPTRNYTPPSASNTDNAILPIVAPVLVNTITIL
jgi:hypothetical protein